MLGRSWGSPRYLCAYTYPARRVVVYRAGRRPRGGRIDTPAKTVSAVKYRYKAYVQNTYYILLGLSSFLAIAISCLVTLSVAKHVSLGLYSFLTVAIAWSLFLHSYRYIMFGYSLSSQTCMSSLNQNLKQKFTKIWF